MSPAFGKVVTEVHYKNNKECGRTQYIEESIYINSKNELWGVILDLLDRPDNQVTFTVHKNETTRQPERIIVVKR